MEPTYADVVLKQMGFDVERIPTADEERADWLVKHGSFAMLVEEKTKIDDPSTLARRREALDRGELFPSHAPIKPDNGLARITRKAVKQIAATAPHVPHDFRVVWFTAAGRNHEAKRMQYIATLYGSTNIFQLGQSRLKRCYFFRNSDFFRHREALDGAVVAEIEGDNISARLCMNSLSPRYERFRECALRASFGTAIVDPREDERNGEAYVADCELDRTQSTGVLQFLQSKYGVENLMDMDMSLASVEIVVKTDG
jgi:hypothetical protein